MRKRLITPSPKDAPDPDEGWLDLDRAGVVEVTSEEKEYPVETALVAGEMRGWRAAESGTQTIRLIFDEPQKSNASRSSSRKPRQSAPKSSSCDGLGMAGAHFERLCASSGISAHLTHSARSKTMWLTSRMSRFLNWPLCLTSVEDRLAPRSRVCACLDLLFTHSLEPRMLKEAFSVLWPSCYSSSRLRKN